ncbi:MAG: TolC family protein [marine benthic group bacterium]|nr:TolC family protein [Gemmatimonadota bacterium]
MRRPIVAVAVFGLLAGGCSFAPDVREPTTVVNLPEQYAAAPVDSAAVADSIREVREAERWWTVYEDPVLEALVDTALAANLDLREAVARVEEVRQRYRIARADLFPQIGLSADGTYQDAPTNAGFAGAIGGGGDQPPGSPSLFPDRFQYDTWTAALGFSYEIDFWGKYRNQTKAAISEFLASEGDYETARLAVISATIATYAEIVELRRQVELTTFSVDILRERAELTNERYYSGLVTTFELYTIQSLYRNTEATLPVLESLYEEARGRLSILLGRYAGTIDDLLG